jgi:LmbE family N-acetylglucosaminyl deacetylase
MIRGMRARATLALVALAACGDNELPDGVPLAPGDDLVVVAHEDDDLLFAEPDVIDAVRAGTGVTMVYVTAGNGTGGTGAADKRYVALQSAYADAAGASRDAWSCGWIIVDGHVAQHCRLDAGKLSFVFLGYPDGGVEGEYARSLLHLWEGTIAGADTIAQDVAHYDREALIAALASIVATTQPKTVRTLEVAATHGHDHSDHMIVGALAVLAVARAASSAELVSYRGYDIQDEPTNKLGALFSDDFGVLAHYEACATGCAACGDACTTIVTSHVVYLGRRYAVGFRRATGVLRADDGSGCLDVSPSGAVALGDCASAVTWQFGARGELRALDRCLRDDLTLGACDARFFLDDEGHVWSATPPLPQPNMDFAHLDCLDVVAGAPALSLCGDGHAPTWDVVPPRWASTPRAALGLASSGRAVRLADATGDGKADLCAVEGGALLCAPGNGDGTFAAAIRIDDPTAPLAIDPLSLAFGDVDGDGRLDACGRDAAGVLCATAANGFRAARWSSALGDDVATPATSSSFAIATAGGAPAACATTSRGIACIAQQAGATDVRTRWPDPNATAWLADLDGDGEVDWCESTPAGPACGVRAQLAAFDQGMPWGYSFGGVVDGAAPPLLDANATALVDIDRDGRADLCSIVGRRIACARSSRRGFGPRATLAIVPPGVTASALWIGDVRGDAGSVACIDGGDAIYCAP